MAIEIPNNLVACGFFDPAVLPTDPILSGRGYQAFNPAADGALPDFAGVIGGFTRLGPGSYIVKTIEGQDPGEAVAIPTPLTTTVAIGAVPLGVPSAAPPPIADGTAVSIAIEDFAGVDTDAPFTLTIIRYATGPQISN